jgi:hypothetical protein
MTRVRADEMTQQCPASNKAETTTMLPVIESFLAAHQQTRDRRLTD